MTESQIKNSFFIFLTCSLFFINICIIALLQKTTVQPLLCFFIVALYHQYKSIKISLILLGLSILSCLHYNLFGLCLFYLIPAVFITQFLNENLQIKKSVPHIILLLTLIAQQKLITHFYNINFSLHYALESTMINGLILSIFLLLYNFYKKKETI